MPRPATIYDHLAERFRRTIREEVRNHATSLMRFTVVQPEPLVIESLEGDLVLEDGDPDFVVGDGVRQIIASYGFSEGDQVLVVRSGGEYHAIDSAANIDVVP